MIHRYSEFANVSLVFGARSGSPRISRGLIFFVISVTVEPRLPDTPEMQPSMIMQTLHSVRNAISIDLHIIRTPEMWTPRYSVKWTLGLAPTVPPPIQTHPYSGHFDKKSVDLLVKQTARRAKA